MMLISNISSIKTLSFLFPYLPSCTDHKSECDSFMDTCMLYSYSNNICYVLQMILFSVKKGYLPQICLTRPKLSSMASTNFWFKCTQKYHLYFCRQRKCCVLEKILQPILMVIIYSSSILCPVPTISLCFTPFIRTREMWAMR